MKNLILLLAVSATLFSCSTEKLTVKSKTTHTPIQVATAKTTAKVSFASQVESPTTPTFTLPQSANETPTEAAGEASTTQSIAKYIPVYKAESSTEVNNSVAAKKLSLGKRLKLKAIKAIFGKNAPESKSSSDVNTVGGILNKLSFWFGLFSIVASVFVPGLGFTFGIFGLIFGIIGTTISSSNKETGMLGILLSAIGILASIIFAAIYNQLFFNRR